MVQGCIHGHHATQQLLVRHKGGQVRCHDALTTAVAQLLHRPQEGRPCRLTPRGGLVGHAAAVSAGMGTAETRQECLYP